MTTKASFQCCSLMSVSLLLISTTLVSISPARIEDHGLMNDLYNAVSNVASRRRNKKVSHKSFIVTDPVFRQVLRWLLLESIPAVVPRILAADLENYFPLQVSVNASYRQACIFYWVSCRLAFSIGCVKLSCRLGFSIEKKKMINF
jgi:hypothetical protein